MTKLWTGQESKHSQTTNDYEMMISPIDRVESIVGKGENAGNHSVFKSLLPQGS